jgi:hypothetical protein
MVMALVVVAAPAAWGEPAAAAVQQPARLQGVQALVAPAVQGVQALVAPAVQGVQALVAPAVRVFPAGVARGAKRRAARAAPAQRHAAV